ncbi:hypothetical protein [Paraburkholderia sp. J69-1]|uniref:hypothetical protein n=1 Tax=Paraburkholderia sp. J69-1 TaxID=2805436 RepID=UPI002AB7A64A|nr:hypothetical protein [Paraburkholderia sp. J69-1]
MKTFLFGLNGECMIHDGRSEAAAIACLTPLTIRNAKPPGEMATFSINATRDISIDEDVASLTIPTRSSTARLTPHGQRDWRRLT